MSANASWSARERPTETTGRPGGAGSSGSASAPLPGSNLPTPNANTFEELEIPASYRTAVEKELTAGEEMLWVGRPSRNPQVHPKNTILPIAGGALIGLAIIIA